MKTGRGARAKTGEAAYLAADLGDRTNWIAQHAPLVKRIAYHVMARLPANVDVGDLIQAGMLGLIDAVTRYENTQGAQFETYAVQRIRGAIFDELRRNDWLPRSVRKGMRQIEAAIHTLEQRGGRHPLESEIAAHMKIPLEEYRRTLQDARGHQILYVEDFNDVEGEAVIDHAAVDNGPGILDRLLEEEFRKRIATAIDGLPEREKLVMSLYYEKELNLREIGEVLGVTEARVCQLHAQAVGRLRAQLVER